MHPHHRVALSYLWQTTKQFLYSAKGQHKHSDDQRIVEDLDAHLVVIFLFGVIETRHNAGDIHADDSKEIHPVRGPLFATGFFTVIVDPKLLNFIHCLCCAVVVVRECPKA